MNSDSVLLFAGLWVLANLLVLGWFLIPHRRHFSGPQEQQEQTVSSLLPTPTASAAETNPPSSSAVGFADGTRASLSLPETLSDTLSVAAAVLIPAAMPTPLSGADPLSDASVPSVAAPALVPIASADSLTSSRQTPSL